MFTTQVFARSSNFSASLAPFVPRMVPRVVPPLVAPRARVSPRETRCEASRPLAHISGRKSPKRGHLRRFIFALTPCLPLCACSSPFDLPQASEQEPEFGRAAFALTAEAADKSYALRHATFTIAGQDTFTLSTDDDPGATTLTHELQSGAYSVELMPGYSLVEVNGATETEVEATLQTPNPQSVLVAPDQTTTVTYLFQTAGKPVAFGPGSLAIAIEVEQTEAPGLVISEFMVNPSALADTAGEWIEITNTADTPMTLDGCRVLRDGAGFTIGAGTTVPAQAAFALANSASPGFSPGYVYAGLTLPNSAGFTLALECNGAIVDQVVVEASGWPLSAGISAALDSGNTTATKNDAPAAWCLSSKSYGTDYGSPGTKNEPCTQ